MGWGSYSAMQLVTFQETTLVHVNSSPSSATYMHLLTRSALVHVMACRLFGSKPLPEPMLT